MCKGLLFRFVLVVLHFPAYTVPLFLHRCSSVLQDDCQSKFGDILYYINRVVCSFAMQTQSKSGC